MNEDIKNKILELLMNDNKPDITFSKATQEYLNYVLATKSKATYEMNTSHIKLINKTFNYLGVINVSQINNDIINQFINCKKELGYKNATINKELGLINRIIRPYNDLKISKLKETQPKIEIIQNDDIARIVKYANRLKPQNRLIVLLLIATGIRRTELTKIKLCNIDLENNSIYLEDTKTSKPRFIYFDNQLKQLIEKQTHCVNEYLFEYKNNQISANQISCIIKRIKKDLNIKNLSPHKFRHTFATHLILNGANIDETANLLGHSNYNMTKRYIHINNDHLKKTSQNYNPLNSIK